MSCFRLISSLNLPFGAMRLMRSLHETLGAVWSYGGKDPIGVRDGGRRDQSGGQTDGQS